MSNSEEALQPLRTLADRLSEIAESCDLEMQTFVFMPGIKGRPDTFQVGLIIRADAVMNEDEKEQKRIDAQFASMEAEFMLTENVDKKMNTLEADIDDWLNGHE